MNKWLISAATTLSLVVGANAAMATTVSFGPNNWTYNSADEVNWTVDINDDTSGFWTFDISANAGPGDTTGSLLAFGFNSTLTGLGFSDFAKVSGSTAETITDVFADTNDCGTGCNFNGALNKTDTFDYLVKFGGPGASTGLLSEFSFTIATSETLMSDSFSRLGIRAQTIGAFPDGGGGSVKDLITSPNTPPPPSAVPLPAAGWLLLAGVAGLGAMKRRRK